MQRSAVRSFAVALAALCLMGCGPDRRAVVASTEHCGGFLVAPELLLRLSKFSAGIPSDDVWVVQLCHPARGCNAVAEYMNGFPPRAQITAEGLEIDIPNATDLKVLSRTTWIGGVERPLLIRSSPVRSREELDRLRASYGLPPGDLSYAACNGELSARPFYARSMAEVGPTGWRAVAP